MGIRTFLKGLAPLGGMVAGGILFAGVIGVTALPLRRAPAEPPQAVVASAAAHLSAAPRLLLTDIISGPRVVADNERFENLLQLVAEEAPPALGDEVRIALVIGNKDYTQQGWALKTPIKDAELIRTRLIQLGFSVDFVPNATRDDLEAAYARYESRLRAAGKNAVSVVYYAGHGIQDNGNYLVPVNAKIESASSIEFQAVRLESLIEKMMAVGNRVNLIFLDACRNNPFAVARGQTRIGLAAVGRTPNFLISYATQPGRWAFDRVGDGDNSPYTRALANALSRTPEKPVYELMQDVRDAVLEATDWEQVPAWDDGLLRASKWSFLKGAPAETQPAPSRSGRPPAEAAALKSISEFLDAQDFNASYLFDLFDLVDEAYGFDKIRTLAARNDPRAAVLLGTAYFVGRFVARDAFSARREFRKACDLGELRGCTSLGYLLVQGFGGERDFVEGRQLHKRACDGGNAVGCASLGELYYFGLGVETNVTEAARLFRIACEGGYLDACNALGHAYFEGKGVARNYAEAVRYFRRACESGNPSGCTRLGFMHANGMGAAPDDAEAARLFRYACEGGDPEGCNNLGVSYAFGRGAARDDAEAVRRYRQSCESGYPLGCSNLGFMYENGRGVQVNPEEAERLYRQACDGGDGAGCFLLAQMYEAGRGPAGSAAEARALYQKACGLGFAQACLSANGQ